MVFFFKKALYSSIFSSNKTCCLQEVCPTLSTSEEWTAFWKTVQFLSGSSELSCTANCTVFRRLQISLMKACLLISYFSLETSSLFGTFLHCGCRTGWIRTLSLLTTSLWYFQLSTANMVYKLCHSDILSVFLPHYDMLSSKWDASIWNEGESMFCCGLVDRRPADYAQHISWGEEVHYCCIWLCHLIRSLLSMTGDLYQHWHGSHQAICVYLFVIYQKWQNTDHHRTCRSLSGIPAVHDLPAGTAMGCWSRPFLAPFPC